MEKPYVVLRRQGHKYTIYNPYGDILCGPKMGMDDHRAIRWAQIWLSSFPDWQLIIEWENTDES